tara:strand:+ start:4658 stop:5020 length:363 start_codon:yes stop_codon:yes gene_type:complete
MIWTLLIIFIIIFLFLTNSKIEHRKLRNSSKKIHAEVAEYRREKGPMRNDYTFLNYPYVRIETKKDEYILVKLSFANNANKPFYIGEKISVFWNNDYLLYWNAYENGLYKYLPESWKLIK